MAIPLVLCFPNPLLMGMNCHWVDGFSLREHWTECKKVLCSWQVSFLYLYQWHISNKILFILQEPIEKIKIWVRMNFD